MTDATKLAILNANYIAKQLSRISRCSTVATMGWWPTNVSSTCATTRLARGVEVEDVAKRLMDYGFHAPTVSWPVAGTVMVEPTESESKEELDRFLRRDDRHPRRDQGD